MGIRIRRSNMIRLRVFSAATPQSSSRKNLTRDDPYAHTDLVQLADGQIMEVPRTNLAAAKALLAAQHAAERRVAEREARELRMAQARVMSLRGPSSPHRKGARECDPYRRHLRRPATSRGVHWAPAWLPHGSRSSSLLRAIALVNARSRVFILLGALCRLSSPYLS